MPTTAIYDAQTNCLREKPSLQKPEKPDIGDFMNKPRGQEEYAVVSYLYNRAIDKYNAHIASLRKDIPCDPRCREIWTDGQEVGEGRDFEIAGAGDWKWCYQLKGNVFARPSSSPLPDESALEKEAESIFPTDSNMPYRYNNEQSLLQAGYLEGRRKSLTTIKELQEQLKAKDAVLALIKQDCESAGIPMDLVLQSIWNRADKAEREYKAIDSNTLTSKGEEHE